MTTRLIEATRQFQSRLKHFFENPPGADAGPLEICEAIVDEIEAHVQPLGRGRRTFPYDRVIVRVAQVGADRPALRAAFVDLDVRVRRRLKEVRCDVPESLELKTVILKRVPEGWPQDKLFAIDFEKDAPATAPAPSGLTCLTLRIIKGAATQETYQFTASDIAIGRCEETADARGRVRRNDVAFLDQQDGVTETVGRAHARLVRDAKTGHYAVVDEGSSNGTSIARQGGTITVASRDPRGVRLQAGDELRLGRAVLRIELGQ